MRRKVFRILAWGGLGDAMLLTPSLKALKETYPNCRVYVYIDHKEYRAVFLHNPYVDAIRQATWTASPITGILLTFKLVELVALKYGHLSPSYNYPNRCAADLIAELLAVKLTGRKVQIYLTEKEDISAKAILSQYQNVVIVHPTPKCSPNKAWQPENWRELVRIMPEYTFVQLGLSDEEKIEGAVDLRGQVSLRMAMAIIKNARAFVGVDSSLAHLTNAFDLPGVVLFGPSTPGVWGHDNNINIWKPTRCAPCIDELHHHPCPYGKGCMVSISVQEVKAALLSQLENRPQ